jgi:lactate dehydrogenase-like 2-hydroxyacid dehydrogenase
MPSTSDHHKGYVIDNTPVKIGRGEKMTKPHILQVGPYPEWDQGPLDHAFHVHRLFEAKDRADFLAKVGPQVRAIATRGELGANAAMIAACPNLEVISVYGVGYDAVDLIVARARGIRVTNTPDVLTKDVADLGVAMLLAQSRGMIRAETWVRDGSWVEKGLYPLQQRVWGKRVGILGLGRIGHEVAKRLVGFDLDIVFPRPAARRTLPDSGNSSPIPSALPRGRTFCLSPSPLRRRRAISSVPR